jgi:eukaryotic-like serine/threonine-protein kinase
MSRAFLVNQTIGEYRIESFLGAGGMGEVYRAVHQKIGRVAAVKVLTQATQSSGFRERFFNEARIQASLQHPNIATLYDFCEVSGQPCIIMEYVDGETVSDRLEAHGPLATHETAYVFEKVVEAVEYIHRHGIIHRDIKSNNIKLSSTGQVKLLDFGIAKGQTSPGLTDVGSVVGTLHYLAPELIRGGAADARGDIWALGVLLYEMATGRVPFHADTIGDLCDQIKRAKYPPPAQLNPAVRPEVTKIIARCLREDPSERYASAGELLRDVRRLAAAPAPPPPAPRATADHHAPPKPPAAKPFALVAAGLAAVVVLAVGGVGLLYVLTSSDGGPAPGPPHAAATAPVNASRLAGRADAAERTIEIHVFDGRAEVFRDGQRLGTTPYPLKARLGEHVRLTLRRDGYKDEPVDFTVTEKKSYTFTMQK